MTLIPLCGFAPQNRCVLRVWLKQEAIPQTQLNARLEEAIAYMCDTVIIAALTPLSLRPTR
jgi:hypothetical protein